MVDPVVENQYELTFNRGEITVDVREDLASISADTWRYSREGAESQRYEEQIIIANISDGSGIERRYAFTIAMDKLTTSRVGTPTLDVFEVHVDLYRPEINDVKTYTGDEAAALYDIVVRENRTNTSFDELSAPNGFDTTDERVE